MTESMFVKPVGPSQTRRVYFKGLLVSLTPAFPLRGILIPRHAALCQVVIFLVTCELFCLHLKGWWRS